MVRLEFEENEKKRLAKEAAYAEAEREHVQVHQQHTVLTMQFLCIMVFHLMHEEMYVPCKQKHILVLNVFPIGTVLFNLIVLHSLSLLLHSIRKSLL